jgi:hypothetical protein
LRVCGTFGRCHPRRLIHRALTAGAARADRPAEQEVPAATQADRRAVDRRTIVAGVRRQPAPRHDRAPVSDPVPVSDRRPGSDPAPVSDQARHTPRAGRRVLLAPPRRVNAATTSGARPQRRGAGPAPSIATATARVDRRVPERAGRGRGPAKTRDPTAPSAGGERPGGRGRLHRARNEGARPARHGATRGRPASLERHPVAPDRPAHPPPANRAVPGRLRAVPPPRVASRPGALRRRAIDTSRPRAGETGGTGGAGQAAATAGQAAPTAIVDRRAPAATAQRPARRRGAGRPIGPAIADRPTGLATAARLALRETRAGYRRPPRAAPSGDPGPRPPARGGGRSPAAGPTRSGRARRRPSGAGRPLGPGATSSAGTNAATSRGRPRSGSTRPPPGGRAPAGRREGDRTAAEFPAAVGCPTRWPRSSPRPAGRAAAPAWRGR